MPFPTDAAGVPTVDSLGPSMHKTKHKKIWVDLDNSPHVPFFRPILEELRNEGYEVVVTARDAYQVRELIEFYGVQARIVGKHYGKHKILKALGTCWRALALTALMRKEKPDLAVCHGSRGLLMACALLKIPSIMLMDYEFTAKMPSTAPKHLDCRTKNNRLENH
jgi:predicted glycosyltransferase